MQDFPSSQKKAKVTNHKEYCERLGTTTNKLFMLHDTIGSTQTFMLSDFRAIIIVMDRNEAKYYTAEDILESCSDCYRSQGQGGRRNEEHRANGFHRHAS